MKHKKLLIFATFISLFGVALLVLWDYFSPDSKSTIKGNRLNEQTKVEIEPEGQPKVQPTTSKDVNKVSNKISIDDCLKQKGLYQDYFNVYGKLENLGMNGSQLAGVDSYQQIPLEGLSSYAEAGDVEAMYLYGVELMWKAGLGFYHSAQYRGASSDSKKLSEQAKNHEFDAELFRQGRNYLYKAAVQGKILALVEIAGQYRVATKKLAEQVATQSEMTEFIAEGYAYQELAKHIYHKDELLIKQTGLDNETLERYMQRSLSNVKLNEIKITAEQVLEDKVLQLKKKWKIDRAYYGLETFPNFFTDREEGLFYKALNSDCY